MNKHALVVTFEQNSTPRSRHKNERDHYPLTRVELIRRVASHDIGIFCYRDVCRRAERHDMRADPDLKEKAMAQKVLVQFVDDLDGTSSEDVATVQFGLDGVSYEVDLNADNAERLRKIYAEYVAVARRTGGRLKPGSRPGGAAARSGEAGQIREWALENGFALSGRGRIPAHVIEAYQEATTAPKPATKRSSVARKKK